MTALTTRQFINPDGGALPRWAEKALESLDSPLLRILAGLTSLSNQFEIDQYLRRCSEELGGSIPPDDELPRLHARFKDMLSGNLALIAGANNCTSCPSRPRVLLASSAGSMIDGRVEAVREGHLPLASIEEDIRAEARSCRAAESGAR